MTTYITPHENENKRSLIGGSAISKFIEEQGRFPTLTLSIKPLQSVKKTVANNRVSSTGVISSQLGVTGVVLDRFLSYSFSSSILVPVDTFTFEFVAPDGLPIYEQIKDGDIAVLAANGITIATGIVDLVEVETDADSGERGRIEGRDLMAQLEDQDAMSMDSTPIWGSDLSVANATKKLLDNTRIRNVITRNAPSSTYLLSTDPGESKLAALQRFLEPLNCIAWCDAQGSIIVGKPNFSQAPIGTLTLSKEKRFSNVMSMRATRTATSIPNAIVPVWVGQETVTDRVSPQEVMLNAAERPNQLFKLGHRVIKSVVVSTPEANSSQGLSATNALKVAGANILQAYAKREIARANIDELIVQAVVPGHYNEIGEPYVIDTVYNIEYDRGSVSQKMYLYQVQYEFSESRGQITNLWFCNLGAIVSDVRAQ